MPEDIFGPIPGLDEWIDAHSIPPHLDAENDVETQAERERQYHDAQVAILDAALSAGVRPRFD